MVFPVRLGFSPTITTTVVHSHLRVSVLPSVSLAWAACCLAAASSASLVCRLAVVFLSQPSSSAALPVWLFWLIFSSIPWLSEFHAIWFSRASGRLLILDWLLSSFLLWLVAKGFYLRLHLGQNSSEGHLSRDWAQTFNNGWWAGW